MNLPRLQINQVPMRIGLNIQKPDYVLEPGKTNVQIDNKRPVLTIHQPPPAVVIDQTQCWRDMGLKSAFYSNDEFIGDAKQQALNGIARIASEGSQLGAIENKANTIAEIAKSKRITPEYSFQYGNVPGNFSLHYSITPGKLNIQYEPGAIQINMPSTPSHQSYTMGIINGYVQQQNQLSFEMVGGSLDVGF